MAVSEARQWQTLQRQRRVKERDAKRAKRRALVRCLPTASHPLGLLLLP